MPTETGTNGPTLTHSQAVNRLRDITAELERLGELDEPTPDDETYFGELRTEFADVDKHRKKLERDAALAEVRSAAEGITSGPLRTERGAYGDRGNSYVADSVLEPDSVEERRFRNPWDLSEMRSGLTPIQQASEVRSRALSAIERMAASDDKRKETMTRFIERFDTKDARMSWLAIATSSDAYVRAFGKLLSSQGDKSMLDDDEQQALVRAMSLTDSAGGYLVPFQLDPSVINTADGSFNQVRQISRQVVAVSDVWNGISSAGVTGRWAAEASEAGDNAPTLAQPTVPVHKLDIFVPISIEALQDAMNVAQEVAEMIAFEKDRMESVAFVTGSGSGQPTGIITALDANTDSEVATATANVLAQGDVFTLDEALPARYRQRASWLAHRAIYNDVRQFDTGGGGGFWTDMNGDAPARLLGRPTFEAEAMESDPNATVDSGAARSDDILVYGDFQNYVVADRVGTTVEFIPHLFHTGNNRPSGQRGWYAYARVGADSVNDKAFRLLQA